jgi:hypothetical protein
MGTPWRRPRTLNGEDACYRRQPVIMCTRYLNKSDVVGWNVGRRKEGVVWLCYCPGIVRQSLAVDGASVSSILLGWTGI